MLPKQLIPENQKDAKWGQSNVSAIVNMVGSTYQSKAKDRFCYDMFNGVFSESDYDYLRKVDKYEYPAKIRFIPLIRPRLDRLRSQETKRPFLFRVFTVDSDSVSKKTKLKSQEAIDLVMSKLMQRKMQMDEIIQTIADKEEELAMVAQQNQEKTEEVINKQREIRKMQAVLQSLRQPLNSKALVLKEEMEAIDLKYRFEYKELLEMFAEKGVKFLMNEYDIKSKFTYGFDDKLVGDNEFYYVNYHPGDPDPMVRKVNTLNFYYSNDDESEWVSDCEWAMEERWMTMPQIIDEFGTELKDTDLDKLKKDYYYTSSSSFSDTTYQYGNERDYSSDGTANSLYSGTPDVSNKIRVCYCVWKSVAYVNRKKTPNKHVEDAYFTHILGKDESLTVKEGETIETRYKNDIWEGVQINNNTYVRVQKMPVQLRSIDNPSKVELPYVGRAFNGITRKPYSIVWAAKDIQILYNLVHFHKELWLALSGVKGFIMDKSQLPDGMSMQEWMYQRKVGVGWIQSVKEGMGRQATFNQFQHYDDTVTPAIQYLNSILEHLEGLAGTITGVNRQSLGAMDSRDLKGVTDQAIVQASLVTEILFYEHDQTKRKVLDRLINLTKIAWRKGRRGQFVLGDLGQEILNIPEHTMENADYRLWIEDGGKQEKMINDLKRLSFEEHNKGLINMGQVVKLYSMESVREMEKALEKFSEIAEQKAGQRMQNEQEAEQQKIQMENEFKSLLEKQKNELGQMQLQIQGAQLEWEKQKFDMEQKFKDRELAQEKQLTEEKIDSERAVEMAYLKEKQAETIANLQVAKIQTQAKVTTDMAKVGATAQKAKEKIKD